MLTLVPFANQDFLKTIEIKADLILHSSNQLTLNFKWSDANEQIDFTSPEISKRYMGLWQYTCFEAFIKPSLNSSSYFELNFNPSGAWNVFVFSDYRTPQPPQEIGKASFAIRNNENLRTVTANFECDAFNFSTVAASLCAVVKTKNLQTSYWSTKHADEKPNFHHFESFKIERSI